MKTFITICFSIFSVFTLGMLSVFALPSAGSPEYIWNTDTDRVLNTSEISDNNPIREGMYWTVHNPQGDPHSVE
ncbi:MAG: hypothetical protein LBP53_00595 [Candidatus Peribacteria bacterium]|nr:hypothetical protein [Candidatus Peribacteria bacterium]